MGIGPSSICGDSSWVDPVGIQVGIETRILEVNENSFLSSGLNFSWQGAGYRETYGGPGYGNMSFSGRVRLAYINVPFIYTYLTKGKFYGEIGLQPGFLLIAKDKYNDESYDYKDHVKKFELGIPIGVGYQINELVGAGIRMTYGITDLDKSGEGKTDHNFLLTAMVKYKLKWPGK
jgi:hypothetical protein